MFPIIENAASFAEKTAIIDGQGHYSYNHLHQQAHTVAQHICGLRGASPGPVLFLIPSGFEYVAVQWGIWLAGGIAVPVHTAHPPEEIRYLLEDTRSTLFLFDEQLETLARLACSSQACIPVGTVMQDLSAALSLPEVPMDADAMMIYTSGTTGRPKGVVMTHRQLDTQMRSLSEAWAWCPDDHILNVLPMHHVHGVINITCCALYNGATLEMHSGFDAARVAARMTEGVLTLFMAVPTIYHKLAAYFEHLPAQEQHRWQQGMQAMRLMVSGSAALPVTMLEKWRDLSGHTLLERYGMTEIGMALSNPLKGIRKPGFVGLPLPFVSVKIMDETGKEIAGTHIPGELYVCGATVFRRYWNRPEETLKSFDGEWFKTGDIAERDEEGYYRILGRNSSDIIKSGGYKISALEIENVLLEHSGIAECAVVALPNEEWGETIAAAYVGHTPAAELQSWLKDKLAPYKLPRQLKQVNILPRNAMGKVLKKEVKQFFS